MKEDKQKSNPDYVHSCQADTFLGVPESVPVEAVGPLGFDDCAGSLGQPRTKPTGQGSNEPEVTVGIKHIPGKDTSKQGVDTSGLWKHVCIYARYFPHLRN